jgi:hypothetical protein
MANGQELKTKFIELITDYRDLDFLDGLYSIAENHSKEAEPYLTPSQFVRLQESSREARDGKRVSHEDAMKMMSKWPTK